LEAALDFVYEQLKTGDDPILPRLESEMMARALAAEDGNEAKAAKRLGLPRESAAEEPAKNSKLPKSAAPVRR